MHIIKHISLVTSFAIFTSVCNAQGFSVTQNTSSNLNAKKVEWIPVDAGLTAKAESTPNVSSQPIHRLANRTHPVSNIHQVNFKPMEPAVASSQFGVTPQPTLAQPVQQKSIQSEMNGVSHAGYLQPTPVAQPNQPIYGTNGTATGVAPAAYTPVTPVVATSQVSNNCCTPNTTTAYSPATTTTTAANPCCPPPACCPTNYVAARPTSAPPTVLVKDGLKNNKTYYTGKGLIGQPKLYVENQPIRNFFRFIFP